VKVDAQQNKLIFVGSAAATIRIRRKMLEFCSTGAESEAVMCACCRRA